jgi:uncharacterized protein (DUF4415 family)
MNDEPTGNASVSEHGTDWEKLRRLSDADIHAAIKSDPDAVPTDEAFWKTAELVMPQRKPVVTIRLDADVLAWLKEQGKGYQTRINAILRAYMEGHKGKVPHNNKPTNG